MYKCSLCTITATMSIHPIDLWRARSLLMVVDRLLPLSWTYRWRCAVAYRKRADCKSRDRRCTTFRGLPSPIDRRTYYGRKRTRNATRNFRSYWWRNKLNTRRQCPSITFAWNSIDWWRPNLAIKVAAIFLYPFRRPAQGKTTTYYVSSFFGFVVD